MPPHAPGCRSLLSGDGRDPRHFWDDAFRTGDLGCVEPDGAVRFRGVQKPMFTRGGFNVYPREVERALEDDPRIASACVTQAPDPGQGYQPQGYQSQGYQSQGYQPQGYQPQGYPPQGYPHQPPPGHGYPPPGGQHLHQPVPGHGSPPPGGQQPPAQNGW